MQIIAICYKIYHVNQHNSVDNLISKSDNEIFNKLTIFLICLKSDKMLKKKRSAFKTNFSLRFFALLSTRVTSCSYNFICTRLSFN